MPTRIVTDDDEQQIQDLIKEMRRLRARLATTSVKGAHDDFTAAATPATTYQLTYIPVYGTCQMFQAASGTPTQGHQLREGTDYTCDYDTGIVTVSATLTSGDKLTFRYLVTDWLIARSLLPEMDQISDNLDGTNNAALGVTSDGKATWNTVRGPWEHLTNQAHATTIVPATAGAVASIDCGNANGTVQATLATTEVGVAFRIVDNANFWVALPGSLYRVVAGSFSNQLAYTLTPSTVITVVLAGSLITVFHGATSLGTTTDSTFATSTKHGIFAQRALSTDLINDWSWTSP